MFQLYQKCMWSCCLQLFRLKRSPRDTWYVNWQIKVIIKKQMILFVQRRSPSLLACLFATYAGAHGENDVRRRQRLWKMSDFKGSCWHGSEVIECKTAERWGGGLHVECQSLEFARLQPRASRMLRSHDGNTMRGDAWHQRRRAELRNILYSSFKRLTAFESDYRIKFV